MPSARFFYFSKYHFFPLKSYEMDPKFEVLWGSIWRFSCWSLPCRFTVHAAVIVILVPAKFIPEQLLDPICHFFFSPSFSLLILIILSLTWPRSFSICSSRPLLSVDIPDLGCLMPKAGSGSWLLAPPIRPWSLMILVSRSESSPIQKDWKIFSLNYLFSNGFPCRSSAVRCVDLFHFFFPTSLHYRSIILL